MNAIETLCRNLNVPLEDATKPFTIWRFNVLHVRGVDNLNSEDVCEYFSKEIHSIEWLSNISCNVSFEHMSQAASALVKIGKGLVVHRNDSIEGEMFDFEVKTSDSLEIPVPPNYRYILGNDHPKAKSIIIRFATIDDKKTGVFVKQKNITQLPQLIADNNNDLLEDLSKTKTPNRQKHKFSMRMRADEEEEAIRRNPNHNKQQQGQRFNNKRDLRSRIGFNRGDRLRPYTRSSIVEKSKVINGSGKSSIWRRSLPNTSTTNGSDLRRVLSTKSSLLRVQVRYDD